MRMKLSKKNYIKLHYVYKAKKGSGSSSQNLKRKNIAQENSLNIPEQDTK